MLDLVERPEIAEAICAHVADYCIQRAQRLLDLAGGEIDIIASGGDIGSQRGMLLNPDLWRAHVLPHTGRMVGTFKAQGYATFYHSCGAVTPVIDDLIAAGVDILDPVQVSAAGMTPEELAPRFAGRITFHGAIDQQRLLPQATPDDVYRVTTRTIDLLGPGFIVTPSHQVQGDTPPENVEAVFKAARAYRWR